MGRLQEKPGTRWAVLGGRALVGRSDGCALYLDERSVSHEHATLSWHEGEWRLRDLASRNGTFVDGSRIASGTEVPIPLGAAITFGTSPVFTLVEAGPPGPQAQAEDRWLLAQDDLLVVGEGEPDEAVVRLVGEGWVVEAAGGEHAATDGMTLEAGGQRWSIWLPKGQHGYAATALAQKSQRRVKSISLRIDVSADQEYVSVILVDGSKVIALPPRASHELLLLLARARQEDAASGLEPSEQGWRYADDVARDLGRSLAQLNLDVHRSRRLFAKAGVVDADDVIERRPTTRQTRLGVSRLDLHEAKGLSEG